MYCPKCAAQNLDDAKFCRACGADISLVPQALAGERATKRNDAWGRHERHARRGETPSVEQGIANLFLSVAFFLVAYFLWRPGGSGDNWWFYMLIPALIFLGKGLAALASFGQERRTTVEPPHARGAATARLAEPQRVPALPPRDTDELIATPSVTEATTRHLGVPVERKPKDV